MPGRRFGSKPASGKKDKVHLVEVAAVTRADLHFTPVHTGTLRPGTFIMAAQLGGVLLYLTALDHPRRRAFAWVGALVPMSANALRPAIRSITLG